MNLNFKTVFLILGILVACWQTPSSAIEPITKTITRGRVTARDSGESRQHIIFEIAPEFVTQDRTPTDQWLSKFAPSRDSKGEMVNIEPLHLPTSALQNPALNRILRLKLKESDDIDESLRILQNTEGVSWAELSPIRYTCGVPGSESDHSIDSPPNDPYYPLQWYLHKINAIPAWDVALGDSSVTIAIVDIGVNLDHNDLQRNRWVNYPEKNGVPGVDDDGNGFIDDVHGWDFYDDDSDPRSGGIDVHGTHVAGLAAAVTDNGFGISGVSWNCRYMAVRVGGGISIRYGYEGVIYAAASGADIINLSWGSNTPSNIERITIEYANQMGALVIAAAGNRQNSTTPFNHYPAAYENVMGVAAVDTSDKLANLSNYNSWVDISAPGIDILSTVSNGYGILSGTSMATPIVSGAAALLKSMHPNWTHEQLRLQLMLSSDPIDNLNPRFADSLGYGRLNLYRALADRQPGFQIADFSATDGQFSNHNGIIDPDEDVELVIELKNLLLKPANVSGWISSKGAYLDIDEFVVDFGIIDPGESVVNAQMPFQGHIYRLAQKGRIINCELNLTIDVVRRQSIPFSFTVQPPYVNHNNGNIILTVTNFGAFGYWDYLENTTPGEGMRFPKDGLNGLFHGSLMISTAPGKVSDCAFGDSSLIRRDFVSSTNDFHIQTDDENRQISISKIADTREHIEVGQKVISYPHSPDDDYVFVEYTIKNKDLFDLDSVLVALFLDWDIVNPSNNNYCKWDEDSQLGWMGYNGGGFPVFGAALLDQNTGFQVAVNNNEDWPDGKWERWSDNAKYQLMQQGFSRAETAESGDCSQLIGSERLSIAVNDSLVITFAILAGEDEGDLIANHAAAVEKMQSNPFSWRDSPVTPSEFALLSLYPQPFNGNVNLSFRMPDVGRMNWDIFNLTGRKMQSGFYSYASAGVYSTSFDMGTYPSGIYLIRLGYEGEYLVKRLTLLR